MQAGKAIYNILAASAVNSSVGGRIYPQIGPQNAAAPFIVYVLDSTDPSDTKSGVSTLDTAIYDVIVVSSSYSEMATISDQVRAALDRYAGTVSGVEVQSIQLNNIDTDYDQDSARYMSGMDFNISIKL